MKKALPLAAAPAALVALAPYAVPVLLVVGAGLVVGAVLSELFGSDKKPSDESAPPIAPVPDVGTLSLSGSLEASERVSVPSQRPPVVRPSCRSLRSTREDLEAVFATGPLSRADATSALRQRIGCGRTAAYRTLSPGSRLSAHLREDESGRLSLVSVATNGMSQD